MDTRKYATKPHLSYAKWCLKVAWWVGPISQKGKIMFSNPVIEFMQSTYNKGYTYSECANRLISNEHTTIGAQNV